MINEWKLVYIRNFRAYHRMIENKRSPLMLNDNGEFDNVFVGPFGLMHFWQKIKPINDRMHVIRFLSPTHRSKFRSTSDILH